MKTIKEVDTIKTFVFTSSVAAMFYDSKPLPDIVDEKCWSDAHMLREKAEKGGENKAADAFWY